MNNYRDYSISIIYSDVILEDIPIEWISINIIGSETEKRKTDMDFITDDLNSEYYYEKINNENSIVYALHYRENNLSYNIIISVIAYEPVDS